MGVFQQRGIDGSRYAGGAGPDEAGIVIIDIIPVAKEKAVPDLLVRGLDPELVLALKERARRNGNSTEAEHRAILVAALRLPPRRSFLEALAAMPDVGLDEDFERRPRSRRREDPLEG